MKFLFPLILFLCFCNTQKHIESESVYGYQYDDDLNIFLVTKLLKNNNLDICINFVGQDDPDVTLNPDYIFNQYIEPHILVALEKWNVLLASHPKWPHHEPIKPNFIISDRCRYNNDTPLKFYIYLTENSFNEISGCNDPTRNGTCRSYAKPHFGSIYLHPGSISDEFTVLHEMGHILGLADTYNREQYIEGLDKHPNSVMNGQLIGDSEEEGHFFGKLSTDDKMGIWALINIALGDQRNCAYDEQKVAASFMKPGFNIQFCQQKSTLSPPKTFTLDAYQVLITPVPIGEVFDQKESCKVKSPQTFKIIETQGDNIKVDLSEIRCINHYGKLVSQGWISNRVGIFSPDEGGSPALKEGFLECPDGFYAEYVGTTGGKICVDRLTKFSLAVVTSDMVSSCLKKFKWYCLFDRWPKEGYLEFRGKNFCPDGTNIDPKSGYCHDGLFAYGPFPKSLLSICRSWPEYKYACDGLKMPLSLTRELMLTWLE